MRIKSIYIDSFGKLSDFNLTFEKGLNTLVADNGFGKTTIAVFIKCMFYGVKGGNKANLSDNNERLKYLTWGTTKLIGGTITFEIDKKEYRIERYFGDKPSQDTFKLINLKSNKECDDYTTNIGEEIFGIDSDGFERSTYIPQKNSVSMGNLTTKITSMLGGTDDLSSIDDIIDNIDDTAKKYYRTSGKSGYIADSKKRISDLEMKIHECENYEKSASDISLKIVEANTNIDKLSNNLSRLKPLIEKAIKSDTLSREYSNLLENIEKSKSRYTELDTIFANNNTSLEVLDGLIILNKELIKIDSKIESLKSNIESLEIDKYSELFKDNPPKVTDIDKYIETASNVSNNTTQNKSIPLWFIVSIAISIAVTISSIALYSVSLPIALVLTILGIVSIVIEYVACFVYPKDSNVLPSNDNSQDIKEFLSLYGYTDDNILENLQSLKSEVVLYAKLQKIKEENDTAILNLESSKIKIVDAIVPYLHRYYDQINDDYGTLLETIKSDYKEYLSISSTLKEYAKSLDKYNNDIDSTLDLKKLRAEESAISSELSTLSLGRQDLINKRDSYLDKANLKQDLQQELSSENEKLLSLHEKYNTLIATSKYIKLAKDEMCSRYLSPITDSMYKYLNKLSSDTTISVGVDTDLNLHVIENTISHDLEYYSKGYKDLFDICFRFAIVDTLFKNTTPFVILDDPFVNLDDKKLANMVSALKELAKEYQIIYLTCSNSRK